MMDLGLCEAGWLHGLASIPCRRRGWTRTFRSTRGVTRSGMPGLGLEDLTLRLASLCRKLAGIRPDTPQVFIWHGMISSGVSQGQGCRCLHRGGKGLLPKTPSSTVFRRLVTFDVHDRDARANG